MMETAPKLVRVDPLRLHMECHGQMVTDATIFASEAITLEQEAVRQLRDAASLPPAKKVLATADIHVGFGVPIGAVMGLDNAIMPAAVGYDINCGMRLLRTPFSRGDINTDEIGISISRDIPLGEGKANLILDKAGLEAVVHDGVGSMPALASRIGHRVWEAFDPSEFNEDLRRIEENGCMPAEISAVPSAATQKGANQLGTLGGGNHFIEIQYVQKVFDAPLAKTFGLFENQIVVMIHSGSRRFGYEVADAYMSTAARRPEMADRKKMLSFLPADIKAGRDYIETILRQWAQPPTSLSPIAILWLCW
ncbi:MAG: RtcB family protein [Planctomycetota bacterium]|jgi:tRNA-splicing ligase RtcB